MTGTTTAFTTISNYAQFGANLALILVTGGGAIAFIIAFYKGGSRFWNIGKKIGKFVDRMDMIIDDFFPEMISGLEKNNLITAGTLARWTSAQAKTLRSKSPIQLTEIGNQLIREIGFEDIYNNNTLIIINLLKERIIPRSNGAVLTDYEIEQLSLLVSRHLFDSNNAIMTGAKNYLYNNPQFPASELITVLGIYIRDRISQDPTIRQEVGLPQLSS